jgi:hypothetical protein
VLAALAATACGDPAGPQGAGTRQEPSGLPQPPALQHDFGLLAHGSVATHELVVDTSLLGGAYMPLRVQLDCSCGRGDLLLRRQDGSERSVGGSPDPDHVPKPGETLLVRVVIDTRSKDAVDLPRTQSRGSILLQPTDDRDGSRRVAWPLVLQFAIDAPVVLHPFAAFDFGAVAQSARPMLRTRLTGDPAHPGTGFGPVTVDGPGLHAELAPVDGGVELTVRVVPGEPGHHAAVVSVATTLPDYVVALGARWKVVPDLEAVPMAKVSLRADLTRAQRPEEATSQFVLVVDHDTTRAPEFAVHRIVASDGTDAAAHFAATLTPLGGSSRQQRLAVRYLGGLTTGFRGRVELTKGGADGPFLPIELVAFAK